MPHCAPRIQDTASLALRAEQAVRRWPGSGTARYGRIRCKYVTLSSSSSQHSCCTLLSGASPGCVVRWRKCQPPAATARVAPQCETTAHAYQYAKELPCPYAVASQVHEGQRGQQACLRMQAIIPVRFPYSSGNSCNVTHNARCVHQRVREAITLTIALSSAPGFVGRKAETPHKSQEPIKQIRR